MQVKRGGCSLCMTTRMAMRECADLERKLVIHDAIDERLWCHINEVRVRRIVPDTAEQREQLQLCRLSAINKGKPTSCLGEPNFWARWSCGGRERKSGEGGRKGAPYAEKIMHANMHKDRRTCKS